MRLLWHAEQSYICVRLSSSPVEWVASRDAQASFTPGSLRLVPDAGRRAQWRRDDDAMRESMFFGEAPEFEQIVDLVATLEEAFNSRAT